MLQEGVCLPNVDFAAAGNIVVDPFGVGKLQAHAAVGGGATHSAVGHVLRGGGLGVQHGMEQVVAAELGEVEAACRAGIEVVALAPYGESALLRRSGRFARSAVHHALQIPVAFRAIEYADLAAFGVDQDEPFCRAAFWLGPFREELVYLVKSLPNATFAEQVCLSVDSAAVGDHAPDPSR